MIKKRNLKKKKLKLKTICEWKEDEMEFKRDSKTEKGKEKENMGRKDSNRGKIVRMGKKNRN